MNGAIILAKNLGGVISKNSPSILTGLGAAGVVTTSILAVRATPKALRLLDTAAGKRTGIGKPLSLKDQLRIGWKPYIPAIGVGAASILCIVFANRISSGRTAAIASMYALTETTLREYQDKVVETIGKNKELAIRDEIAGDRVKANPSKSGEIIQTGKGTMLCLDELTGRYFRCSIEHIRQVEKSLNDIIYSEDYVHLDELFSELGLDPTKLGGYMGWDTRTGPIEIIFSSQLTSDNEPCLVLTYKVTPKFLR